MLSSILPVFRVWYSFCVILSFGTVSSKHSLNVLAVFLSEVTNTFFSTKLVLWLVFTSLPKSGLTVVQNFLLSVIANIWKCSFLTFFDDIHREKLCIYSIQYKNGCLAASDLFHKFTQSIKFYTLRITRIGYRCLKNVIHQIVSKNKWLLLSATQNLGCFCSGKRFFFEVLFYSQPKEDRFF